MTAATATKYSAFKVLILAVPALVLGLIVGRVTSASTSEGVPQSAEAPTDRPAAASPAAASKERYKLPVTTTQPSQGPADALVTVVMWSDLRGETSRKADAAMRTLLKEYDGKLRWVHRALVDQQRKEESIRTHLFARDAFHNSAKYWEVRERFLALPEESSIEDSTLERVAKDVGMDYDAMSKRITDGLPTHVTMDQMMAQRYGIKGKLGVFVNRRCLDNADKVVDLAAALRPLIAEELAEAERVVASGVPRESVYRELTKDGLWGADKEILAAQRAAGAAKPH